MKSKNKEVKPANQSRSPLDLTWTDVDILARYVTEVGTILPRKRTRLPAMHQRHISSCIKQSRNMGLMR